MQTVLTTTISLIPRTDVGRGLVVPILSIISLLMALIPGAVLATRTQVHYIDDPFSKDGKCESSTYLSVGASEAARLESLGLSLESTVIVFCPSSGYTSLQEDFSDTEHSEHTRIGRFLKSFREIVDPSALTKEGKTWMLEHLYSLRDRDARFTMKLHLILYFREMNPSRLSRMFRLFEEHYHAFHRDKAVHYLMARLYTEGGLVPEGCEAFLRAEEMTDSPTASVPISANLKLLRRLAVDELSKAIDLESCRVQREKSTYLPHEKQQ